MADKTKFYAAGFKSQQDEFAIGFDGQSIEQNIARLIDASSTETSLRDAFELCKSNQWNFGRAKARLSQLNWRNDIQPVLFRPFDRRYTILHPDVVTNPRLNVMQHLANNNVAFLATRSSTEPFAVFVTNIPPAHKIVGNYDMTIAFPLWLKPQGTETRTLPNIAPAFADRVAALTGLRYDDGGDAPAQAAFEGVIAPKSEQVAMFGERRERGDGGASSFGPRDLFDWIYAVLHSPSYRARYDDYLKSDFARIPLPEDRALFQALVPLGTRLIALHLLDAKAAPELNDPKSVRLAGAGEARVTFKSSEFEKSAWEGGRMYIAADKSRWFETVPERVANFHIGGYRPARKWLKDRTASGGKRPSAGRVLSEADILHYRRMIVAMDQTIDLMAQIDTLIEAHGGWPDAFRGIVE